MRIKKTSQYIEGGAGLPSYFTDEIDTGMKWVDGKPIYRKVIVANLDGTYSESGQRFTFINNALGGAGTVDNMIRLDATYIKDGGDRIFNLLNTAISGVSGLSGTITYRLTSNNNPVDMFQIAVPTSVTTAMNPVATIITEYTKQSD